MFNVKQFILTIFIFLLISYNFADTENSDTAQAHWKTFQEALKQDHNEILQQEYQWLAQHDSHYIDLCQLEVLKFTEEKAAGILVQAQAHLQKQETREALHYLSHLKEHMAHTKAAQDIDHWLSKAYLQRGLEEIHDGNWESAIEFFKQSISLKNNQSVNFYIAYCYVNLKNYSLALKYAKKTKIKKTYWMQQYYLLGICTMHLNQLGSAKKFLDLSFKYKTTHTIHKNILITTADVKKALNTLNQYWHEWQSAKRLLDEAQYWQNQAAISKFRLENFKSHKSYMRFRSPQYRLSNFRKKYYSKVNKLLEQNLQEQTQKMSALEKQGQTLLNSIQSQINS